MKTYIFKINLFRDKKVIREIEVTENMNLYKLAKAIVGAYDFDFDHAFGFFSTIGERYFDSERKYELFADMENEDIEPKFENFSPEADRPSADATNIITQ